MGITNLWLDKIKIILMRVEAMWNRVTLYRDNCNALKWTEQVRRGREAVLQATLEKCLGVVQLKGFE